MSKIAIFICLSLFRIYAKFDLYANFERGNALNSLYFSVLILFSVIFIFGRGPLAIIRQISFSSVLLGGRGAVRLLSAAQWRFSADRVSLFRGPGHFSPPFQQFFRPLETHREYAKTRKCSLRG